MFIFVTLLAVSIYSANKSKMYSKEFVDGQSSIVICVAFDIYVICVLPNDITTELSFDNLKKMRIEKYVQIVLTAEFILSRFWVVSVPVNTCYLR